MTCKFSQDLDHKSQGPERDYLYVGQSPSHFISGPLLHEGQWHPANVILPALSSFPSSQVKTSFSTYKAVEYPLCLIAYIIPNSNT